MPLSSFGRTVRFARIDGDLFLGQMAKAIGVTPAYLSAIEAGRRRVTPEVLQATIKFFADHGIDIRARGLLSDEKD
jgi:transcriptional regulator with XRE-family HTH domain